MVTVPDLAFNELRFLQKPRERQDEQAPGNQQQKPNNKDRNRQQEQEISAYFNAKKAPLDDTHGKRQQTANPSIGRGSPNQDAPVDLPDKPFLGFGSKGAPLHSQQLAHLSTAYYSWSDSADGQAKPKQDKPNLIPALDVGQLSARKPRRMATHDPLLKGELRDERTTTHVAPKPVDDEVQTGTWIQSRRALRHAPVDVYEAPPTKPRQRSSRRSITKTTSQSLPQPSSPPQIDPGRGRPRQDVRDDYRTSDILGVYQPLSQRLSPGPVPARHNDTGPERHSQSGKENRDPDSSDSTGKLLLQAQEAFNHRRTLASQRVKDAPVDHEVTPDVRNIQRPKVREAESGKRHLRQAYAPHSPAEPIHALRTASLADMYQPTGQGFLPTRDAPRNLPSVGRSAPFPLPRQATRPCTTPIAYANENDMLDDQPDTGPPFVTPVFVYAGARQAEELVFAEDAQYHEGIFEDRNALEDEVALLEEPKIEQQVLSTPSVHGLSAEQDIFSERSVLERAADSDGVSEFAGFWRPHKLY